MSGSESESEQSTNSRVNHDHHDDDSSPLLTHDSEDSEDVSMLDVLRYLLQGRSAVDSGAQLRLRLPYTNSSSDDDEDEAYRLPRLRNTRQLRERTPKPPENPDTSVIDASELKQQMRYESGCFHPGHTRIQAALSTTPGQLLMKEAGIFSKLQNMTHGQRVAASCHYLPNIHNPVCLTKLRDKFFCGIYNNEGDVFMSACQDAYIRLYDTSNGRWKEIKTIPCRDVGWSILDIEFSHGGNHVIYSSWSEYVHLCNIRGEQEVHEALYLSPGEQYRTAIFSLRFNNDDSEIIAGANNGFIYIYNRERSERTVKIDAHEDDLSSVCFADISSHIIYSGGEDGLVKIWDRRSLREDDPIPVGQLSGHHDSIVHIDSRNDGRYLLTNSKDQSIKLWDIRKLATSEGIAATKRAVSKQEWDYRWHAYVGKIVKKKLPGDCSLMTYYGHSVVRTLIRARFSPSFCSGQKYIYCGDGQGRVIIYDILSGSIVRILESNRNTLKHAHKKEVVRDVSWHPYENNIISSGWDCRVVKWEPSAALGEEQSLEECIY